MDVPLEYYFIALSVIVGFIAISRGRVARYLRLFPFFLLIALANEIVSWQLGLRNIHNIAFYNFFSVGAFVFYMYMLSEMIFSKLVKKWILYFAAAYAVGALYNILFIQGIDTFHTITYSIGCFMIVAVSIYYFLELFQRPRYVDLKKEPAFWIASGLLFFFACTPAIFGLINYIASIPDTNPETLFPLISILNVSLYSLFTIAFLCRINFKRYMS